MWHVPVLEGRGWGHGARGPGCPYSLGHSPGQCILAPGGLPGSGDTVLVGVGLTSLVTCVGEDGVQEDGGWVVTTIQVSP